MTIQLFAGYIDKELLGMETYQGQYDDYAHAMRVAEGRRFHWAQLATIEANEIRLVNQAKYNPRLCKLIWMIDTRNEKELRAYLVALKMSISSGVLILEKRPGRRPPTLSLGIVTMTQMDKCMSESFDAQTGENLIISAKEILSRMVGSAARFHLQGADERARREWLAAARALLRELDWTAQEDRQRA